MSERKNPPYPVHRGRERQMGAPGREARKAALAPLFQAVRERGIAQAAAVILAYRRRQGYGCTANHAYQIRIGRCPCPPWLVDEICAIIGVSRETIYPAGFPPSGPLVASVAAPVAAWVVA